LRSEKMKVSPRGFMREWYMINELEILLQRFCQACNVEISCGIEFHLGHLELLVEGFGMNKWLRDLF